MNALAVFKAVARVAAWLPVGAFAWVVLDTLGHALGAEERGEVLTALVGSLRLVGVALAIALPIALAAALLLEDLAPHAPSSRRLGAAFSYLSGLPAIVIGLVAVELELVVGSTPVLPYLALAALALPTAVEAARAALREVPNALELASLALGASPTSVVLRVSLPAASSGLVAGSALVVLRLLGETITLVMLGAASWTEAPTLTVRALVALRAGDRAGAALALSVLAVLLFATSTLVLAVRARGGVEAPRAEARPA